MITQRLARRRKLTILKIWATSGKTVLFSSANLRLSSGGILLDQSGAWYLKMWRILVVDDYEPVRRRVQALLGSHKGWAVCGEATDGIEAVEEAKSLRPDLIVMDVSMLKMNGLDASRIILREVRGSRILIIRQNDPTILRQQAVETRARGFIEKSTIQRDLIATIEGILSSDG